MKFAIGSWCWVGLLAVVAGCATGGSCRASLEATDGLVSYWDFGDRNEPLVSKGPCRVTLRPGDDRQLQFVEASAQEGRALHFDGSTYFMIPYAETGALNVRSGQVTVVAWLRKPQGHIGFVGGMWNEYENGGKRQYGLFVSLPYYNGADQVCGHISRKGGPTPPFPYSIDYSASRQVVPDNDWCMVAFTYDGKYIRSYLDGRCEAREPELIDHTKGFAGYPDGLVQSKNPYFYPDGIGDNGSDFTVGAVRLARGMGNFFQGDMKGLAVFGRALSESELLRLVEPPAVTDAR